jgi:hypothetical protein
MVRRTGADAVTAGAGARSRRVADRAGAAPAERPASLWEHRLLAGFFVTLVIPGNFSVAGFSLSASRLFLLLAFVPLFLQWFRGRAWRITASDIGILLYCFWIWVAILVVHGPSRVPFAGIQFVEMFGGYLVGRTLVRSAEGYRTFVRYLFWTMAFLFPFALTEFLTGWSPLRAISEAFLTVEERNINRQPRLGFVERVQGPFAHSILFGLFCSLGVANFFFVFREALVKRVARVGMALVMIFTSLSSAPFLVAGLQLLMMGWDRLFAFMRARWVVLVALGLVVIVTLEIFAEGGVLGFVFETFLLVPQTGYFRLVTLEFGTQSVLNHPFFGVGQGEWVRPYWRGHPTIDNFWLAIAVRYGLPTLVFLWLGIACNARAILLRTDLDPEEQRQRRGYLIALTGLVMILASVSIWGPVSTFVLTYFGAGVWFYARDPVPVDPSRLPAARPAPGAERTVPRPGLPARPGRGTPPASRPPGSTPGSRPDRRAGRAGARRAPEGKGRGG